jgi:hypothetical protein
MLDFSKFGDMAKIAQEARQLQERQEHMQKEQLDLLKKMSGQLDTVIALLKE